LGRCSNLAGGLQRLGRNRHVLSIVNQWLQCAKAGGLTDYDLIEAGTATQQGQVVVVLRERLCIAHFGLGEVTLVVHNFALSTDSSLEAETS
jgi:hypothetical protein